MWQVWQRALGLASGLMIVSTGLCFGQSVRLAVTDIVGLEGLQREFGAFRSVLSAAAGLDIQFFPVSNRTVAVEVLKSKKVEFVLTGPAEYVVFRKRTDAYPVVGLSRPDYFSAIIVMADKGLNLPYVRAMYTTIGYPEYSTFVEAK